MDPRIDDQSFAKERKLKRQHVPVRMTRNIVWPHRAGVTDDRSVRALEAEVACVGKRPRALYLRTGMAVIIDQDLAGKTVEFGRSPR